MSEERCDSTFLDRVERAPDLFIAGVLLILSALYIFVRLTWLHFFGP